MPDYDYDLGVIGGGAARHDRPLRVQILGPRAGDILGEWVAVLNGGIKLSTLAGAIHPRSFGEINKKVAGAV